MEVNMDLTYTEMTQLITAFKKQETLWNPHLMGYNSKETKEEAWLIVAAESGIEPEVCKRKMKSLMSSCRREKIKIIKSRRSGDPKDILVPKWRYWNAFKFLRGVDDDDEDPLGTAPEMDILDPTQMPKWFKMPCKRPAVEKEISLQPQPAVTPIAKESIGAAVASKLKKMYHDQRLFAENLINQALYKGLLCELTAHSEIRTPNFQGQESPKGSKLRDILETKDADPFVLAECQNPVRAPTLTISGICNTPTDVMNVNLQPIPNTCHSDEFKQIIML